MAGFLRIKNTLFSSFGIRNVMRTKIGNRPFNAVVPGNLSRASLRIVWWASTGANLLAAL